MKKVVVYWSGTGNTMEIANKIASDLDCDAISVSDASIDDVLTNDLIIFGCPAMGAEELESDEFEPFYEAVMSGVSNQKIALFGSYGWGDGEWMRNWEEAIGSSLITKGLIVNGGSSDINESEYEEFINALK